MRIAYGIEVLPKGDPYIELSEDAIAWLNRAGEPAAMLLDMLPMRMAFSCIANTTLC